MLLVRSSVLAMLVAALLTLPAGLADEARPVHLWAGTADERVHVDGDAIDPVSLRADVKGLCADVEPILSGDGLSVDPNDPGIVSGWEPTRDGTRETGVGGACMPFGDDANQTMLVTFQAIGPTGSALRAVVCVDVDGDGTCGGNGDRVDLCRLSNDDPVSVWTGGPCQVFADPAAADPTIYFLTVTSLTTDAGGLVQSTGVAGYAFAYRAS